MVALVPVAAASCCFYAYIVGGVFGLMGRLAEERHAFTSELTRLNAFMRYHNLDNAMRVKIREFLHFKWGQKLRAGVEVRQLALSTGLTEAVYAHTHIPNLSLLPQLRYASVQFLAKICEHMKPNAYSSGDFIIPCAPSQALPALYERSGAFLSRCALALSSCNPSRSQGALTHQDPCMQAWATC